MAQAPPSRRARHAHRNHTAPPMALSAPAPACSHAKAGSACVSGGVASRGCRSRRRRAKPYPHQVRGRPCSARLRRRGARPTGARPTKNASSAGMALWDGAFGIGACALWTTSCPHQRVLAPVPHLRVVLRRVPRQALRNGDVGGASAARRWRRGLGAPKLPHQGQSASSEGAMGLQAAGLPDEVLGAEKGRRHDTRRLAGPAGGPAAQAASASGNSVVSAWDSERHPAASPPAANTGPRVPPRTTTKHENTKNNVQHSVRTGSARQHHIRRHTGAQSH